MTKPTKAVKRLMRSKLVSRRVEAALAPDAQYLSGLEQRIAALEVSSEAARNQIIEMLVEDGKEDEASEFIKSWNALGGA